MSRLEIQGWVQIVLGIVGIVLTILSAPELLQTIGVMLQAKDVPGDLATFGKTVSLFAVIFVLVVLAFITLAGLAIILSIAARSFAAKRPMLCASLAVLSVFTFAVCLTIAVMGSLLWLPALVAACALLAMATSLGAHHDPDVTMGIAIVGGVLLFITGAFAISDLAGYELSSPASEGPPAGRELR